MQELKPCPFCGGKEYEADHIEPEIWIVCDGCGATSPTRHTLSEAIQAWNTRASEVGE